MSPLVVVVVVVVVVAAAAVVGVAEGQWTAAASTVVRASTRAGSRSE